MTDSTQATRRYRGMQADERRAERRARLIDAAIEVYGEVGYRSATVRSVCDAAQLTERYFYESFENSEALLIAAYLHVTEQLHAEMAAVGQFFEDGSAGRAEAILTVYFKRLREEPRSAHVFLLKMGGVGSAVDAARVNALAAMGRIIVPAMPPTMSREGKRRAGLIATGMVGAVVSIALRWVSRNYADSLKDVVAAAAAFCEAPQRSDGSAPLQVGGVTRPAPSPRAQGIR